MFCDWSPLLSYENEMSPFLAPPALPYHSHSRKLALPVASLTWYKELIVIAIYMFCLLTVHTDLQGSWWRPIGTQQCEAEVDVIVLNLNVWPEPEFNNIDGCWRLYASSPSPRSLGISAAVLIRSLILLVYQARPTRVSSLSPHLPRLLFVFGCYPPLSLLIRPLNRPC